MTEAAASRCLVFDPPLLRGTLIRRYARFLADVRLDDGRAATAHCPNSGSMLSVNAPGSEVWLSPVDKPGRKLAFTWELIRVGEALVGINTNRPNALVADAIGAGAIAELVGYESCRREVRYGRNSRIDILLEAADRSRCLVEVKNVTLKRGGPSASLAEFPDAVTERGRKHLNELATCVGEGCRSVMLFLVQRGDCEAVAIASDIDPAYADALRKASAAGVEILCYGCEVTARSIRVDRRLAVRLPGGTG